MIITRNDKRVFVNAKVVDMSYNSDNSCVNIKISVKGWDSKEKKEVEQEFTIPFWNSRNPSYPQLADRIQKADVTENSIISVYASEVDGKLYGNNFCYSKGWFKIPSDEGKETNVVIGYIAKEPTKNENRVRVDIPIDMGHDNTKWFNITFWNNDNAPMADRASACLRKGDHVAIITGAAKVNTSNGKEYTNYTGYQFEILARKKAKEETPDSATVGGIAVE